MQRTARRDTAAEMAIRRELHHRGLRYFVDRLVVPGTRSRVDIVFPGPKVAIFVDGCFWHSCPVHKTVPKVNRTWWVEKLVANEARDHRTVLRLTRAGWTVLRFWEHERPEAVADAIETVVRERRLKPIERTTSV